MASAGAATVARPEAGVVKPSAGAATASRAAAGTGSCERVGIQIIGRMSIHVGVLRNGGGGEMERLACEGYVGVGRWEIERSISYPCKCKTPEGQKSQIRIEIHVFRLKKR
jgi:hypothetical protein